jgi:ribonuclease VapC
MANMGLPMVIDTSAISAIFFEEPERDWFLTSIENSDVRFMSAGNVLETAIVLEARRGPMIAREFDLFAHRIRLEVVPVDNEQVEVARAAWRKYGKGRHPAALNFGDCFAYALARISGEPLLAAGNDFGRTDIAMCV